MSLGPCRILGFAVQISTNGNLLHMPPQTTAAGRAIRVHLHLDPTERGQLCARSVLLNKIVGRLLPLPKITD